MAYPDNTEITCQQTYESNNRCDSTIDIRADAVVLLGQRVGGGPAGGVATSALEMSQNSQRLSWSFDEVDKKLEGIMVGINLLREGLDLPEVSLVAILDADKEGFLRSETSLIQTIGRAARNAEGLVIMYADEVTPSMRAAIDETERRRTIQDNFNKEHGIVPKTIIKEVRDVLEISKRADGSSSRGKSMAALIEYSLSAYPLKKCSVIF